MINNTFVNNGPTWANACVGNNGSPTYIEYSKGYSKTANLLLEQVLNTRGKFIDYYIYPICFNMRHSIELRLKGAIEEINQLSKIKNVNLPSFNLSNSHNIENIWIYFKDKSELLDNRFSKLNSQLNQTILDIAKIDPTGQTFRYPCNNSNQKHLQELQAINCLNLKIVFLKTEEYFDDLSYLITALLDEYKQKTYTKNLSRSQIFNIAKNLPAFDEWIKDNFREKKNEIRNTFRISSNELSTALNLIKKHYELSHFLKTNIPLKDINTKSNIFIEICEIWIDQNKANLEIMKTNLTNESTNTQDDFDNNLNYLDIETNNKLLITPKLTKSFVVDLKSLIEIQNYGFKYSEQYEIIYDFFYKIIKDDKEDLYENFEHIYTKLTFLEDIIYSLFFLNQIELAEYIIQLHDLEKYFEFIPQARTRELFKKNDLLCYDE